MVIKRIPRLSIQVSSIWLGPRQTGKSTLIKTELSHLPFFEVNLLKSDIYAKYLKDPSQFRKDILYQIKVKNIKYVFVDEFQKIPSLTNEIHLLIEETKLLFFMSGSSARKLKRGNANMLGGRAIMCPLFPLTFFELGNEFVLNQVLQFGSLAGIYFCEPEIRVEKLLAYIEIYLKEEIAQEGLVRKLDSFHRFLDVAGFYSGEILNLSNIARECGVSHKTVLSYFEILEETLLGYRLNPWDKSLKKQLAKHSKFYFSDNGINQAINQQLRDPLTPILRGKLFEQWVINEIRAYINYFKLDYKLHFWRTERGEYEIDLILSKQQKPEFAIEIKAKKRIDKNDLKSLREFKLDYPKVKLFCLCEVIDPYIEGEVLVMSPMIFFKDYLLNKFTRNI